jgi:hypothetical protein
MKKLKITLSTISIMVCLAQHCQAQDDDKALLNQVEQDDQKAVDAIAMYPPGIRKDIFIAAESPEILVRLNAIQQKTKDRFSSLVAPYSHEEQEKIWNVTRYPALIHDLVVGHPGSEVEVDAILVNYPEEIRHDAKEEAMKNYDLLANIDNQTIRCQESFESILRGYPGEAGDAYRDLIRYPEVINTLYDNMQLTVVIGDVYKRDPMYVMRKTDSLNQALAEENARATAEWKQSMTDNPQAQDEYVQATQQYEQENGYSQDEYTAPLNTDINTYPSYSYNWWFGYPSWYPYAYWDPNPFWYDGGFYYGPNHNIIFFGMPSPYFMSWYFYYPDHHSQYPELSNHYYNYYYGHRNGHNSNAVSRGVDDWRRRNKDVVNSDWDKDSKGRVQKFKEYGQMETARLTYNKSNPQHPLDHTSYLQKNSAQYPSLRAEPVKENGHAAAFQGEARPPQNNPHVNIPESYKANHVGPTVKESSVPAGTQNYRPPVKESPRPNNTPRGNYTPARATEHSTELHNAQQYHQQNWEQSRPAPQQYSAPAQHYSPPAQQHSPPSMPSGGGGRRR